MRDSVTFIHAADLHLGAPFQGLSTDNEAIGRELAEATYSAWTRVVDAALEHSADFVVLAGDLYDAGDPSLRSQMALRSEAQRLDEAGIRLLIVRGNHDPLGGWSAGLAMPESVHVFPSGGVERFEAIDDDGFVCAVYGRSYQRSAETSDFTPGYARDPRDTVAIGLLHANVGNNPDHDPYAPCSLGALSSAHMDYWALGHIHKHGVLAQDPHVVYAGSAQGLNPKETGAHGCCVVTISRGGATTLEHMSLAPVTWASVDVDITGADSLDRVEALVNAALDAERSAAPGPVAARVRLAGRAAVQADLARPGVLAQLADAVRAEQVAQTPWVWLDRLADRTAAAIDVESLLESPDFAGEVARIAAELATDPAAAGRLLHELSAPLLEKLPDYQTQLTPGEIIVAARDRALDLLIADDGGAA